MTPVTPAQLFGVLAGVVVFGGINLGIWLLRGRGLALAVEDERDDPDEVPVIVADYGRMGKLPEALYGTEDDRSWMADDARQERRADR